MDNFTNGHNLRFVGHLIIGRFHLQTYISHRGRTLSLTEDNVCVKRTHYIYDVGCLIRGGTHPYEISPVLIIGDESARICLVRPHPVADQAKGNEFLMVATSYMC
ncbi:unnamed protein product [Rhizophagus irregularis]|nr:unnamed protein product [Rhizophagus irregularis]CAB4415554.1 unnamed protein product [Rhizophagus irregularis]